MSDRIVTTFQDDLDRDEVVIESLRADGAHCSGIPCVRITKSNSSITLDVDDWRKVIGLVSAIVEATDR